VPDGWIARLESEDVNTPKIETTIRGFDDQKKIEITEDFDKQYVRTREAVYIAFPFAMDHPQFQYEVQNGVVDPTKDMLPGAGHEWFSQQHWVSVQQNGFSATVMPLDAGLVTLGDIYHGLWPTEFGDRKGSIFSFAMNNYWSTNYLAGQGGHFRLRYVITSAPSTNAAALSRLGWEESTSLEANEITRQDKAVTHPSPLDAKQESFLQVNDPALLLQAWKPSEDGRGFILRFLDLGAPERSVTVDFPLLNLAHVTLTDAVERDQHLLTLKDPHHFTFTIHPHEIVTLRLETAAAKP
jgi:alpha-mannosidase